MSAFTMEEALKYEPKVLATAEIKSGSCTVWRVGPGWIVWFTYSGAHVFQPVPCGTKRDLLRTLYDGLDSGDFATLSWKLVGKVF